MLQQPHGATRSCENIRESEGLTSRTENQRTLAVHTDSRITLREAIAIPRNRENVIELIREEIRILENNSWVVHFTWVKELNNNS